MFGTKDEGLFEVNYSGEYVNGKMESTEVSAEYGFPSGTTYVGTFKNGCFHGEGVLKFPGKGYFKGKWKNGELLGGNYTFEDGLNHDDTASFYCTEKDRRYHGEHLEGVPPAGASLIRNEKRHSSQIPPGTYDCMDGYFDESTGLVHDYETGEEVRKPTKEQIQVIKERAYFGFESKE